MLIKRLKQLFPRANLSLFMRLLCVVVAIVFILIQTAVVVSALSPQQLQLFNEGVYYFDYATGCETSTSGTPAATGSGVSFDDSQSSDTGGVTAIDDDGIDPSPTGSSNHQGQTAYANGQLGALHTNYFALNPGWAAANGLTLGDVGALTYKGKTVYAVYGDNHVGNTPHAEISVAAAMALTGVTSPSKAENSLSGVHFTIYPGTHTQLNGSVDQSKIDQIGQQASGGGSQGASTSCGCGSSSSTLTGSDNQTKVFNYFIGKGLTDMQAAAIVGNFQQESGTNPNDSGGYLAQWGGARLSALESFASSQSKPVTDLGVQLDFVWQELNSDYKNVLTNLKSASSIQDAVNQFMGPNSSPAPGQPVPVTDPSQRSGGYEDPGIPDGQNRVDYANQILGKSGSGAGGNCSSSPDCTSATGDAKILCEAKKYDPLSYSQAWHMDPKAWHQKCTTISPSCATDCSGLVDLAVYDAFNNDIGAENTYSMVADHTNWKQIPASQAQPGDIFEPNPDHVEIVDHIVGTTIYAFASHTDSVPQPDQTGPDHAYSTNPPTIFLHYIGPGSS